MADNDKTGGLLGPILDGADRIADVIGGTLPHAVEGVSKAIGQDMDALVTGILGQAVEGFDVSEASASAEASFDAERDEDVEGLDEVDRTGRSSVAHVQQASAQVSPAMESAQAAVVDEDVDEDAELHSDENEAAAARRKKEEEDAQDAAERQAAREEAEARAEAEQERIEAEAEAEAEAAAEDDPDSD
ncbi:MAG: DNA segregation ATPase FtsK/SpoIIIE, S-DNA-T family [Alphaproteobacteria bacterium]|nr:MAG: DNA segregation ATPase FtsK/SpoIIIE S-DNA-T family [Caulobacteraceae bacterium]TPW08624.1 MAG: DNA segregation ATPase FtsK/SpoIIIE, S-DNA-T family [Alphaproteobacteria bacterium]